LARKQKLVRCSVCGEVGRRKRNTIVERYSYPEKIVAVPNISQFRTTADAWDYAAKVCLRMSQRALKDPPLDLKFDDEIAELFYEIFRKVVPHSDADIRNFESIHRQRIKERLAKYTTNSDATVSRMSLSLLYGATVCTIMSDKLYSPYYAIFEESEIQRKVAYAIYTFFSQLLVDERAKATWLGWSNIIRDYKGFGPGAAAKMHSDEIRGGSLSRKQVKDRASDVLKKEQDVARYEPAFLDLLGDSEQLIKNDRSATADMLISFEKYQFAVYDQERKYEYAWVVHDKTSSYNPKGEYFKEGKKKSVYSNKSKSRWCPISPYQSLPIVSVHNEGAE
jgi:hypothetical protein